VAAEVDRWPLKLGFAVMVRTGDTSSVCVRAGIKGTGAGPPVPESGQMVDWAALILLTLLSSLMPIAVRWAVATIPPIVGGIMRFSAAAVIIGGILAWQGRLVLPARQDWLRLVILGIICVPINQATLWGGTALASPSHAAMFYSTTPVMVTVIACLVGVEQFNWRVISGALCAVVGVLVVLINSGLTLTPAFLDGDLLLLMAAMSWSLYLVFSRPLTIRYGTLVAQFWVFLFGSLISAPLLAVGASGVDWGNVTPLSWAGLLYLTVFVAVGVFFLYNWCIGRQPPSRVTTFGNAAFPLTLVWESVIKQKLPGGWFLVGSAFLIAGMIMATRRTGSRRQANAALPPEG
jgi:drug/metabolite transporter (DMT)-like permease